MATTVCRARFIWLLIVLAPTVFATLGLAQNASPISRSGIYRGHRVSFQIVKGKMIFEGDIALEHVDQKLPEKNLQPGATLDYLQYRWPQVGSVYQIPYSIDPSSGDVANINAAVSNYNSIFSGIMQWVSHTSETDYVNFKLDPTDTSGAGNSYLGRVGGQQPIWGSGSCTVATLLHEMGHATGFWHEQSRPDRNNYVTVLSSNMINTLQLNSAQQFDNIQSLTLYDWGSLMHYGAWGFTKNGAPTLESIPAGMPLSNNVGYSAADIDAIKRLYGAVPTAVTVTTNPPGLEAVVDGATITTPQTFSWGLNSTHTLSVPSNAQTLSGVAYTYGRWNDNGAASHTITVLPGNGEMAFPATAPAVTVYLASFIQLVPYSVAVSPANAGSVTATPAPQSYSGLGGAYFAARQQVTLAATPNAGQNFYQYINSPFWLPGGLSTNPKTFYVMDDGNSVNTTAYFSPTSSPVFTVTSSPADSRFFVIVDGTYWPAPKNFTSFYDSGWNNGSNHTIGVDPTQWPWTLNSRYVFGGWSDGGAQSHNVSLPSTSTTYIASLTSQYYLSDYANQGCAGAVSVVPSSPTGDGFYPGGQLLTFSETPAAGWTFTGWQHDLSGNSNPQNIPMNDELLVTADYNTTAIPLTLTSTSPSAAVAGAGNFTLTLNGTGFSSGTLVFVHNVFRASTFVNANKITVAMTATDLATRGGFQIFAENFPNGAACAAFGALPFNVASSPLVKPTPLSLSFSPQVVSTGSARKTVTLNNTSGTTVNINSITATGDFSVSTPSGCGTTLAPGASCTVSVSFNPAVAGGVNGSVAITDSAPDSPQTVALTGTGTLPLSISPATLPFGAVPVGTTSAAKTATLTNNESSTLDFSFAASGNYAIHTSGTTCGASLSSKASCNIAVTFAPTANGAINGAVTISDGTAFTPQLVPLSGTGTGGSTTPLSFTPNTVTYAGQTVGTASTAKTVTVKNTSASSLTVSGITWSGDFSAAPSGTTPCTASLVLVAGGSCTLSVTFAPALGTSGTINGSIIFADTAPVSQQILDVRGTAVLPLTFAPTTLTFGAAQTVGTASAAQTITLSNNLATTLNPVIAGSGDFSVVAGGLTPCTGTLNAHAKCTFTVTFTPSAVGTRASAITVSDTANPSVETLAVTGTGQ